MPPPSQGHDEADGPDEGRRAPPPSCRPGKPLASASVDVRAVLRNLWARRHPSDVFLAPEALASNDARLGHLASLGLPLSGKRVLEVGAGIGLLTSFFLERGCSVLSTEARPDNVAQMRRRYPGREIGLLDLERPHTIEGLGRFDVIFCYGTLYHLAAPAPALQALSSVAPLILLETCCSPGDDENLNLVNEPARTRNQAKYGTGCRPTRPWVLSRLRENWGHAYVSVTQPDNPDFPLDWTPETLASANMKNVRAVFVGSRMELTNPQLTESTLTVQKRHEVGGASMTTL